MALEYDLSKIANRETVCFNSGDMRYETESIIFATMVVRFGEITEENAPEFYERYELLCVVERRKPFFTSDDVKAHIGLKTNVFPDLTTDQWDIEILGPVIVKRLKGL